MSNQVHHVRETFSSEKKKNRCIHSKHYYLFKVARIIPTKLPDYYLTKAGLNKSFIKSNGSVVFDEIKADLMTKKLTDI